MPTDEKAIFDEFKDRGYADWKRVRLVIEHENTLVNHRLGWLGALQGLLFTAFAFSLKPDTGSVILGMTSSRIVATIIAGLGMVISGVICRILTDAEKQIGYLDQWWYTENRDELANDWLDPRYRPYHREAKEAGVRIETRNAMRKKIQQHPPLQACLLPGDMSWSIFGRKMRLLSARSWDRINPFTKRYKIPAWFIVAWGGMLIIVWWSHI